MLIYESTKKEFMNYVDKKIITSKIYDKYRERIGRTTKSEIRSWENSINEMGKIIDTDSIPDTASIAIEFNIPLTSNRIDFVITGFDDKNKGRVIIIELKQWQRAQKVSGKDGIVKTFLGGGIRETTHPSYQAWSYYKLINEYNQTIRKDRIEITPCVYLHNFKKKDSKELMDSQYNKWTDKAKIYLKEDSEILKKFLEASIKKGDDKIILFKLDDGKLRPSKSLQKVLKKMLDGSEEFTLIDSQKVVYETALDLAKKSKKDGKKRVMIVEGGPGTGKSVVAINLLVNLNQIKGSAIYVSKNAAPRNVYAKKLRGSYKTNYISKLFMGSGAFVNSPKNLFDSIIVDEAHRLKKKSGMYGNLGENQIKETINASKFSIFFLDEYQRIDIQDIGSKEEIRKHAKKLGAKVYEDKLDSQFRCGGSDGYLEWLDDVLEIHDSANFSGFDLKYDIKIFDNPNKLRKIIEQKNKKNNRSRLLAGYCWEWPTKTKGQTDFHDINIPEKKFSMSWNLNTTATWLIDENSINEVGCIHTSQGLELEYAGIIIGPDLRFENGKVITDYTKRAKSDYSLRGIKRMAKENPKKAEKIADEIIRNTYRTLMSRGMKGCYIYCVDEALGKYLNNRINSLNKE